MIWTVFGVLLLATLCLGLPFHSAVLKESFQKYKREFNRTYSAAEEEKRFHCFAKNLGLIEERNKVDTARHGINLFTDLCPEEFRARYLTGLMPMAQAEGAEADITTPHNLTVDPAPSTYIDWRSKGLVGDVKDQGYCGSCWAFSAVAALEGAYRKKHNSGSYLYLSEQFLVSCVTSSQTQGCNGGVMSYAINYVLNTKKGIPSAKTYPYSSSTYNGNTGSCTSNSAAKAIAASFSSMTDYKNKAENAIATALVNYGPLSIGVAATDYWQSYTGGVLTAGCGTTQANHGVAIVGVGNSDSGRTIFWIVRNSWGAGWGEKGYIKLTYGSNCNGLKSYSVLAVVAK